jgi:hypothetical protein
MKPKSYYGPGGALVTDRAIKGVTHELCDDSATYYGGRHFIAESMTRGAAEKISAAFGLELVDQPLTEGKETVIA